MRVRGTRHARSTADGVLVRAWLARLTLAAAVRPRVALAAAQFDVSDSFVSEKLADLCYGDSTCGYRGCDRRHHLAVEARLAADALAPVPGQTLLALAVSRDVDSVAFQAVRGALWDVDGHSFGHSSDAAERVIGDENPLQGYQIGSNKCVQRQVAQCVPAKVNHSDEWE